jgi:MoaA/NifB/PqqE/SkfB family radical SAM enzyme
LVRFLRERGVFVKVITNGITLTPARAAELSAAGLNQVEVSLDGLTPATHELSRGARSLALALAAIEHGQKAGIPRVGVTWTVHSRNLHEMHALPAFMRGHGLRECYLSPFRKIGLVGGRAPVASLQASDLSEILARLAQWKKTEPDLIISLGSHPSCSCGRTSAVLGADGGVRLCPFDPAAALNIRDRSFLSIWRSLRERLPAEGAAGFCRTG